MTVCQADKEIFDKLVADSTDYEFDAFAESVQEAKKDAEANGAILCILIQNYSEKNASRFLTVFPDSQRLLRKYTIKYRL